MKLSGRPARLAPGILFALLSAVLFGASTPLAKLLLGTIDPWMLAGLLYLGSGLGLGALQLGRHLLGHTAGEAPLRPADLPWLAGIVLAGGIIGPVLLMIGLMRTPASAGALLLNLEGLATMGIAWLVFRETWTAGCCWGRLPSCSAPCCCLGREAMSDRVLVGVRSPLLACLAWGIDN